MMRKFFVHVLLAGGILFGPAVLAVALETPVAADQLSIEISGPGLQAIAVTPASLAKMPQVSEDISFKTSKGEVKGLFSGVALWGLLEQTGIAQGGDPHVYLTRTFVVTGRDGYQMAFSIGEISPDFGNTPALIATGVDGKPLPPEDGLRLIVPGDKRGARNVRDVVKIEVR